MHRAVIAAEHLDREILARFVPGDPIGPALHCMQNLINEHLHQRASPRLLWEQSRDRLGLYIVPEGLIGALWLQFARAVERDAKFRQCPECGTWFEIAPGRGRTDKQFCSTACRTRAYRTRQAEAARLHGEGRSIEDIARELESDPATVRGWIERKGGSGGSARAESRIARAGGGGVDAAPVPAFTMLDRCLAGANALAPDLMTAEQRLSEVAQILAAGLMRLRRQRECRMIGSCLEKTFDWTSRPTEACMRRPRPDGDGAR